MKNKDIEKLLRQTKLAPSEKLKGSVLADSAAIPSTSQAPKKRARILRFVPAVAALAACLLLVLGIGLYNESYTQIYIDINPSLELTLNRFNIVNGVRYINEDAESAFSTVNVKGKTAESALSSIMTSLNEQAYFDGDNELYISCYSEKTAASEKLEALSKVVESFKEKNAVGNAVNVLELTKEEVEKGKENSLSPAKNKLLDEILSMDDKADKDEWKHAPMDEIKQRLEELKGGHGNRDEGGNRDDGDRPDGEHGEGNTSGEGNPDHQRPSEEGGEGDKPDEPFHGKEEDGQGGPHPDGDRDEGHHGDHGEK